MENYVVKIIRLQFNVTLAKIENEPELQTVINEQAELGYKLHTISTTYSDNCNSIFCTLVFEKN